MKADQQAKLICKLTFIFTLLGSFYLYQERMFQAWDNIVASFKSSSDNTETILDRSYPNEEVEGEEGGQ